MNTQHPILQTLTDRITSELKPIDREAAFDAMLDDCYSFAAVGGPFMHMSPSSVLKEMDPTAYRCGVNDYADGEAWVEIDGETYDQQQMEEIVTAFREELESELETIENELRDESREEGDDYDMDYIVKLEQQRDEKQAEIDAIAADDFFN